jgi:hypothetical protein
MMEPPNAERFYSSFLEELRVADTSAEPPEIHADVR